MSSDQVGDPDEQPTNPGLAEGPATSTPVSLDKRPTDDEPAQPVADSVWRYHLDVLVGEDGGAQVWQSTDPVLGRQVSVQLLASDDERAEDLREAACLAARVSDRRLLHVLDVVDVRFEGKPHVAIVSEWVAARPLTELLTEPMSSTDALRIGAELAECLEVAHADGIAHGRIRPDSVLLTEAGAVRLRGLGTEAVLHGCDPNPDPAISDVNGVGAVVYACVTGRWPYGELDDMAAAPVIGGGVPLPSRVAPAVSGTVDSLCSRSVAGCAATKDTVPFTGVAALSASLRSAVGAGRENADPLPPARPRRRRAGRRLISTVLGLAAVVGLVALGWQLVTKAPAALSPRPSPTPSLTASAVATPSTSVPAPQVEKALPIIRVSDYDPLGNGAENPELAALAIDGKVSTAWTTVTYKDDYLSGKQGVGLLLDLGAPRPVKAVRLSLLGTGTDVQVLTADKPSDDPAAFRRFAAATGAPGDIVLRSPQAVTARYVLLWITRVPALDTGYQGGVSEVAVLG